MTHEIDVFSEHADEPAADFSSTPAIAIHPQERKFRGPNSFPVASSPDHSDIADLKHKSGIDENDGYQILNQVLPAG